MTTPRLGGRSTWVATATAAATIAGLLGITAGAAALSGSTTAASGGAIVPIVGIMAVLTGLAALVLAAATWLRLGWARPLGLVVAPAFGAIAVIDGLFAAGGLLGAVAIVGVGLAAIIVVSLGRSDVRPTDDRAADDHGPGD